MTQPRISVAGMRPDLRWAEEILGESLQAPAAGLPDLGRANAVLSADVIVRLAACVSEPQKAVLVFASQELFLEKVCAALVQCGVRIRDGLAHQNK